MSITQTLAISNLMNTLDDFFASLRLNIDNLSTESSIQILNILKSQSYGNSISIFDKGVIFGLQACQIKQLGNTWGIGYGPITPEYSLLKNENLSQWVITRGNLFDGLKIVNIEPAVGEAYVYKINPYITSQMENYLVPGMVVYSTLTHTFRTILSGQTNNNYPVKAIEKTGIDKDKIIQEALNYKYFNKDFDILIDPNDIQICKFILDINSIIDYEMYILNKRGLYPFIYGQPYYSFMNFAGKINNYIQSALVSGYDSETVYDMLYYIVNAEIWGTASNAFFTYWTTGGRVLPSNVKYYYNILFDPDIP